MALSAGTRLSDYEILELIGSGGMGEVYRGRDRKLGRDVAIKVLPEAFQQDAQRLARFEREARVLASLNHPGIATLHGLERAESLTFLVMELVSGETLAERIERGAVSLEETIQLFAQIAEALEAAHAVGVVHRDLKPANIKITPQGRVKILDFGLAKASSAEEPPTDLSQSTTFTRDATRAGVTLGTASYMSPEQAKGKLVDKRTDVWAFGCMLFEALAGRKAFDGESVTDVLANVIHKNVSWEALPPNTPWRARDVLRRCLTKDRERRFHDVADARLELLDAEEPPMHAPRPVRWAVPSLLGAFAVGAILAWLVARAPGQVPPGGIERYVIAPQASEPITIESPAITPDVGGSPTWEFKEMSASCICGRSTSSTPTSFRAAKTPPGPFSRPTACGSDSSPATS
ncbi:MAG TPA: serine/threonine-protein kinase [Vicinamibacteria bacterium]|nr:serine/threonine-protein kinase [Vicinamibacteria bacterium]